MIERTPERSKGLHGNAVRVWAILFLTLAFAGQSIIQNQILGLNGLTSAQLLAAMNADDNVMIYVTLALIFQAMEACATPLFALLTVEGFCHTSDLKKYFLRVLAVAAVSEIPYNLAMDGKILSLGSRNPVFGVALLLVTLWFYNRYQEKGLKNLGIKLIITLAAIVWGKMLRIPNGECIVVIGAAIWACRNRHPSMRTIASCAATAVCGLFSIYYLVAPISMAFVHMYNGEPGERNRTINYLSCPVILALLAACALFL